MSPRLSDRWGRRALGVACAAATVLAFASCAASPGGRPVGAAPIEARPASRDVLRRLGYPDTARLVILHADDVAITPGATRATIEALLSRGISSASILAPSAHVDSVATALPRGEPFDLGVHLAITSESEAMRWPSVAGRAQARSLVQADSTLPLRLPDAIRPTDIERELAAQVARVRGIGVTPTHLDSHQGALLFHGAARFDALRRVAQRECLPIPVPESQFERHPYLAAALDDGHAPLADLVSIDASTTPGGWRGFYEEVFDALKPGVTVLIVHLGEDSPEERALFRAHVGYDAAWRARDAAVVQSGALREFARVRGVVIITWREFARATRLCASPP